MPQHAFDCLAPAELKLAMGALLLQAAECMQRVGMTREDARTRAEAMITAAWDQAVVIAARKEGQRDGR